MKPLISLLLLGVALQQTAQEPAKPTQASIGKPAGSFFALMVPDVQDSARWYHEALGFRIVRDSEAADGASRTIMLEQNGVILEIIQSRGSFGLEDVTQREWSSLQGIKKVGIVVSGDTFEALYDSLKKRNVIFLGDIFEDNEIKMRTFLVRDNRGNLLQFFSPLVSDKRFTK
jgi:extradiol dioxygenase family protein